MLRLTDRGTAQTCDGMTRRDFLEVGALSAIGLSLPQMAAAEEKGLVNKEYDDRSVIMIFNLGAPSQMDTFDPKPEAAAEIRGPFAPISTRGDFQITEILPRHAEVADKFSVVRSCYHTAAAVHDTGHQMLQTGRDRKSTRLNSSHLGISYAVFCLKTKKTEKTRGRFTRTSRTWTTARGSGGWRPRSGTRRATRAGIRTRFTAPTASGAATTRSRSH